MDERLQNEINFLRAAYYQAKQSENDTFTMDSETIRILLDCLKDVRALL